VIVFTDDIVEVYLCNRKDKEMDLQPLVHLISALFLSTPSLHLPLHIFSLYLLSSLSSALAKVEGALQEKKYSYLPRDTFKTYVEMHVTSRKLTFKVSGYCRQAYILL